MKPQLRPVTFTALGNNYTGSEVSPKGGHPLNRLATKLARDFALRVIYSPDLLEAVGGTGAYSFKDHILFVPESVFEAKVIDSVVQHEIVHTALWVLLRHGTPLTFAGIAYNDAPELRSRAYGPGFGIDEVVATMFSARHHARALRAELALALRRSQLNAFSSVSEQMGELRTYALRLQTMLTTLRIGIDEATQSGPIATPAELAFLPASSKWQKVATDSIRLFFPAEIPTSRLKQISAFARDAGVTLTEAESVAGALQAQTAVSRAQWQQQTETVLSLVDGVIASFASSFPEEVALMDRIEKEYR